MPRFRLPRLLPRNPLAEFHSHEYVRHTMRRLEHLASLGLPVRGARVLETGAGVGDHTTFFVDRGCTVVATDARPENVERLRRAFHGEPRVEARVLDLDRAGEDEAKAAAAPSNGRAASAPERFDIVYCYGTLYHLCKPAEAIAYMARRCAGMLLVETCVSLGDGEAVNLVREDTRSFSQAASGHGCRPTRPWVHKELSRWFEHVSMPTTQPNHPEFPLDWSGAPTPDPGSPNPAPLSRAVFVASRGPIESSVLTREIPVRQVRH